MKGDKLLSRYLRTLLKGRDLFVNIALSITLIDKKSPIQRSTGLALNVVALKNEKSKHRFLRNQVELQKMDCFNNFLLCYRTKRLSLDLLCNHTRRGHCFLQPVFAFERR